MNTERRAASLLLGVVLAACLGTPATPTPLGSSPPAPSPTPTQGHTALPPPVVAAESPGPAPAPTPMTTPPLTPGPQPTPTTPVATPTTTAAPGDPVVGRMAALVTDTRLVARSVPGTGPDSKELGWYLYPRQRAEVLKGPVLASGYPWYRIRVNEDEGWVVGRSPMGESTLGAVASDQAIVAGMRRSCAVTGEGGVTCWGDNLSIVAPVGVRGLADPATAIAAGANHTCAVTRPGSVMCWGYNPYGQLGGGTTRSPVDAVEIKGLPAPAVAVAAGEQHDCAVLSAGAVVCWGDNRRGQLGDGTTTSGAAPVAVEGLAGAATAIAAGQHHTCALTSAGGARCWGSNEFGQLGDGTTTNRLQPVAVEGLAGGVVAIAAGTYHTCALTGDGAAWCWGRNGSGRLGDGTTLDRRAPVPVAGLGEGVVAIAAGDTHACALMGTGGVKCWGSNRSGKLGDGTERSRRTAVAVVGLTSPAVAIAAGWDHTCALMSTGGVKCWGRGTRIAGTPATRAGSLVPVDVDYDVHPRVVLRPTIWAQTLGQGTTVAVAATVSPPPPARVEVIVRFVVTRRVGDDRSWRWEVAAERDVATDADGRAVLNWTFSEIGTWQVRALTLPGESQQGGPWSASVEYRVEAEGVRPVVPVLEFDGSEATNDAAGSRVIIYWLRVANWQEFEPGLFSAPTDLARCGRTMVEVHDATTMRQLQQWCGLQAPSAMARLGFGRLTSSVQPARVYIEVIEVVDRRLNLTVRSNVVQLLQPSSP